MRCGRRTGDFNVRIRDVRFETAFDASLPPVHAVPQEISRVFLNIVNNAFYAVWERKKARLRISRGGYPSARRLPGDG